MEKGDKTDWTGIRLLEAQAITLYQGDGQPAAEIHTTEEEDDDSGELGDLEEDDTG